MRRVIPVPFPDDPTIVDGLSLGRVIRAARTQTGMTLEEAALAVGIAKQTMQSLENGIGNTSLDILLKVLHGFGIVLFAVPAVRRSVALRALTQGGA